MLKLPPLKLRIGLDQLLDGTRIPPLYGIAWKDHTRLTTLYLPIPFNLLARLARAAYFAIAFNHGHTWIERREHAAYQAGFNQGLITGKAQAGFHVQCR